jgi:hypothetical protein
MGCRLADKKGMRALSIRQPYAELIRVRSANLSITHISAQAIAHMNISQSRHAAPQDHISRRAISLAI